MIITPELKAKYHVTIGIECHVQLKTKTKLFSAVGNDARGAKPNTLISHIDLGMPGALPVLNEKAVEYAITVAFAFNTKPQKHSYFERKHYFYPDLPKGYQITQLHAPIIKGGYVEIEVGGQTKKVRINRVQLEEDAGKNTHPAGADYSLVDLNRAGTPLLEIVSEPDISSAEEAKVYARELYLLMRYADVSDADMYHGNMRFDVNVSVSPDPNKLGTRAEVKNLNSFRSVASAAEYEIHRQIELLESGQKVDQETRGWDDAKQKTIGQRGKEEAHDYRYMPEPDIPPIELTDEMIASVKKELPVLPKELRSRLAHLKIDSSAIETLVEEIEAGEFMLSVLGACDEGQSRHIANWLVGEVQALVASAKLSWAEAKLDLLSFKKLAEMVIDATISASAAKQIAAELARSGGSPADIAKSKNLLQVSDEHELLAAVKKVIADNQQAASDVKNGEAKAIGFLVGQVMKETRGKANPALVQKLLRAELQ